VNYALVSPCSKPLSNGIAGPSKVTGQCLSPALLGTGSGGLPLVIDEKHSLVPDAVGFQSLLKFLDEQLCLLPLCLTRAIGQAPLP